MAGKRLQPSDLVEAMYELGSTLPRPEDLKTIAQAADIVETASTRERAIEARLSEAEQHGREEEADFLRSLLAGPTIGSGPE